MLTWKEIASPGPVWYMDAATGQPARLDFTPTGIKYLHDQGKEMIKSGLTIPIPMEHQMDLKAMTSSERAAAQLKNNTGWVKDYRILPGHRLFGLTDIEDEETYRKLPRTIKYTSPWISSFTDGNGREWKNVISHLALTSRPRITRQEPFPSLAAALSLVPPTAPLESIFHSWADLPKEGVFVSLAGAIDLTKAGKLRPSRPMAFSLWSGATLAEDERKEYAKEKSDSKPPEKKGEPGKDEKKPPEGEKKEGEDIHEMAEEADMDLVDVACDLMSIFGVELPEDTTEENLLQNLMRSLIEHMKNEKGADMHDPNNPKPATTADPSQQHKPPQTVQEAPPMYMSLEQVNALADPQMKQMAMAMLSMQETMARDRKDTESLKKNAFEAALARRAGRIATLARRVGNAKWLEQITAQATSATLSLGEDGVVKDSLSATLDLLESGLKDLPSMLTAQQTALFEQPQPKDHTNDGGTGMSPEQHEKVMKELEKNTGLAKAG